ncbi:type IV pilus assembly protein PilC [Salinibacterium amurskyense]|uniref:Type IV pilus assembly protein PilC n=1 Tax=Salinibacterium amurskyense TaxID=205941 RepID=A0A2M9D6Z9_9MICO|nr:type II secretion system F family protein [Salinibacterium amurskyense]PJJ81499.1 type IV pilus assembly protein PilC [Salinibacterium amurskyense]RLQ83485.1 type II secretion system F family protein [Salinibacterium amurskyense]GHD80285.1 type II secretion system protein F [Salinibacterium amurskyense]
MAATTSTTKSFEYKARDQSGKVVKGRIDASSENAVLARLRAMEISPISVTEAGSGTGLNKEINISFLQKGVGLDDLAVMSRQMSTMISSGLSLIRALVILSEQTENPTLAKALGEIRQDVETGGTLSDAFAKHGTVFPPIMIHLVRAGETGGFLDNALESIANNFEGEVKLRGTIKSALTYPVVVLIMAIAAVVGMLLFIVPVFEEMFSDLGGELPLLTQMLVWMSDGMTIIAPILVVGGIIFSVWWGKNKHTEKVRKAVDPWKLRAPVFGPLFRKVSISRFTRNFGTMLGAGVPILHALSIVGETSGNFVIEEALRRVADSVRSGQSVSVPLAKEPVFPSMVTQMVAVGEDAGSMEVMLSKIADFYDDEVQKTTEQLTALIEPLMIGVIGAIVGVMVIALYMPIFAIFDQIK